MPGPLGLICCTGEALQQWNPNWDRRLLAMWRMQAVKPLNRLSQSEIGQKRVLAGSEADSPDLNRRILPTPDTILLQ